MMDLWQISDNYVLRLSNIVLLLLVGLAYVFARRFISQRLKNIVSEKGIKIKGRDYSLNALLKHALFAITMLLTYGALGYGNPYFSLSSFLNYELISSNKPAGTGMRLAIGQIVGVILVIFFTRITINIIRLVLHKTFRDKDWIDEGRKYTIIQMSRYVIYTISLIVILKIIFGDVSHFIFGASALFVGLGLGLQDFFTDVVSGFILLNDGSIKVGDIIELNGSISKVEKINIRTSHVKTTEGKTIIVPNSKFTEEYLTNWSISEKVTRFHVDVTVAYGTDTELVQDLLYRAALQHPLVDKNNNVLVMFNNFGENGLEFQLYFWAQRTWDILVIKSEIRFEVDKLFRANGIKIPYPQRDLHIITDKTK